MERAATADSVVDTNDALDRLTAAVDAVLACDASDLQPRQQLALVRGLEVQRRRLAAAFDQVVEVIDRTGGHVEDGHQTTRAALTHLTRSTSAAAGRRVKTVRALRALPAVAAARAAGRIPDDHLAAIVGAASNPRVEHHLAAADPIFAELAATDTAREFRLWLRTWEQRADEDGAEQESERVHARRRASSTVGFDGSHHLEADLGALQGAVVSSVFDAYVDDEFHAEWAELEARWGREMSVDKLERTPAQRRADALVAVFRTAGAVRGQDHATTDPLVNVVVDMATFERAVALAEGTELPEEDPNDGQARLCHTLDGTPLTLLDVAEATIVGQVRRVVVGADGVTIDLGRKQRAFRGNARDAVLLGGWPDLGPPRCFWPGCDAPVRRLQIDHHHPARLGGPTDAANGDPGCGHHNRRKEQGFSPDGPRRSNRLRTYRRPDDSAITEAA